MASPDFKEILKSYESGVQSATNKSGNPLRGVQHSAANLANIRLKVKAPEWIPNGPQERPEPLPHSSDGNGGQKTTHIMEQWSTVTITQGICSGLHEKCTLKLKLPSRRGEFVVDIDPSEPTPQEDNRSTPLTLTSSSASRDQSSPSAQNMKEIYDGEFWCKVYPKGKVLLSTTQGDRGGRADADIQHILSELGQKNHRSVRSFTEDDEGNFFWELRGRCKFNIDVQLSHQ